MQKETYFDSFSYLTYIVAIRNISADSAAQALASIRPTLDRARQYVDVVTEGSGAEFSIYDANNAPAEHCIDVMRDGNYVETIRVADDGATIPIEFLLGDHGLEIEGKAAISSMTRHLEESLSRAGRLIAALRQMGQTVTITADTSSAASDSVKRLNLDCPLSVKVTGS